MMAVSSNMAAGGSGIEAARKSPVARHAPVWLQSAGLAGPSVLKAIELPMPEGPNVIVKSVLSVALMKRISLGEMLHWGNPKGGADAVKSLNVKCETGTVGRKMSKPVRFPKSNGGDELVLSVGKSASPPLTEISALTEKDGGVADVS